MASASNQGVSDHISKERERQESTCVAVPKNKKGFPKGDNQSKNKVLNDQFESVHIHEYMQSFPDMGLSLYPPM